MSLGGALRAEVKDFKLLRGFRTGYGYRLKFGTAELQNLGFRVYRVRGLGFIE